jgi:hypothetical protein
MTSREDNPILLVAEETISTLFHRDDWIRLEQTSWIPTPSSATTGDFNVKQCCKIREELHEGFKHIFEHSFHVDTFWEDLVFKLKRAGGIHPVATRKRQNEEYLVTSLIYPTLKKVVDSISIIPGKCTKCTNGQQPLAGECTNGHRPGGAVSSHLVIQDEIRIGNASGRPPAVDATIQISDGKNYNVLVPVEVKVDIQQNHQYQIAAYVIKMSTAKELENKVVIGIIMDKENFHLVFSPYFFFNESKAEPVPLPIVYISPMIMWKESAPQTLLSVAPAALLVIACTCYFQLDRIKCDEEKIDPQVLKIARQLCENRHKIKPIHDDALVTVDDLLQISQKQQKEITDLKTEVEELKKQQVHLKQNGALADSQSSTSSTTA